MPARWVAGRRDSFRSLLLSFLDWNLTLPLPLPETRGCLVLMNFVVELWFLESLHLRRLLPPPPGGPLTLSLPTRSRGSDVWDPNQLEPITDWGKLKMSLPSGYRVGQWHVYSGKRFLWRFEKYVWKKRPVGVLMKGKKSEKGLGESKGVRLLDVTLQGDWRVPKTSRDSSSTHFSSLSLFEAFEAWTHSEGEKGRKDSEGWKRESNGKVGNQLLRVWEWKVGW